MASTWGTNVWGSNSWQSDVNSVAPSGNVISLSIGTEDAFNVDGWGGQTWGFNVWGNLTDAFGQPSGVQLTISQGDESVTGEINAGWGGSAWGENGWGIFGDVLAGSQLIQSAVQSVTTTADADISPTALSIASSVGNEGVQIDVAVVAASQNLTITQGNADPEPDAEATGQALTLTLASVSITNEINIGWGGLTWGANNWGDLANPTVGVTGRQLSVSLGDESNTADANVSVTGIGRTIALTNAVAGTSVDPNITGVTLAAQQTSAFAGELVVVEVTSPVNDEWGTESWGQGFWGVGDGITIFVGTDTVQTGAATASPTGVSATGSLGTLGQASIYEFTFKTT